MSNQSSPDHPESAIEEWLEELSTPVDNKAFEKISDTAAVLRRASAREANAVRHAGLDTPEAQAHAFEQLRFRLRREGIHFHRERPRRWWTGGAAAVAVVAIGLTIHQLMREPVDPWLSFEREAPSMRGSGSSERAVANPLADARRLARGLHNAGLQPILYIQADRVTVSFAIEEHQVPQINGAVLQPLGLPEARAGENQVSFLKLNQVR